MKLGRAAGLVTAACWSVLASVSSSCGEENGGATAGPAGTTGVPGGSGAAGPTAGTGTGGSSGDPRIDYCKEITSSCINDEELGTHDQQYVTESNCREIAMLIPEGAPGDSVGNTIQCRRHYLQFAGDDPVLNCRPAGPASFDGKCGQGCQDFCVIATKLCTGDKAQWPSENACKLDCGKWDQTQPYFASDMGGPTGDNFACRLYQLVRGHCGDIGVDSAACIDPEPPDAGMDVEQPDASDDASDDGGIVDSGAQDADSGG